MTDENKASADSSENPYQLSQEILSVFGGLDRDEGDQFLEKSPFGKLDGLQYIVAAAILKRENADLAKFLGITKDAAHSIMGWAMAEIIVMPMTTETQEA
jgi:hypothetical protein